MGDYKGWLPEEDEVIRRPISAVDAAAILGRTPTAVKSRRARHGWLGDRKVDAEPAGWPVPAMGFGDALACVQMRRWRYPVEPANNLTWRIAA